MPLDWKRTEFGDEAILGNFDDDDGVRFSLQHLPTCHIRGPWRLLIEVEDRKRVWPSFDLADSPMRWYHSFSRAQAEAEAIAEKMIEYHNRRSSDADSP